jgi:hypothetical protein
MSETLIKLFGAWERTRRGNTEEGHFYLAGHLGNVKILVAPEAVPASAGAAAQPPC